MPKFFSKAILLMCLLYAAAAHSQTNVNTAGTPVTENFNSLSTSSTATTWNQNATISGWYAYETDPWRVNLNIAGDSGAQTTGRLYSYGRSGASDRALGALSSGSTDSIVFGWRLKNNTGVTITGVEVSYTGEQWRRAANTTAHKLLFFYKVDSSIPSIDSATIKNLTGNGYTYYQALNFEGPATGSSASILNGNDAANSKSISQTINVTIPNGHEIMLLWFDDDDIGNDHGLAIDDLSVTFSNQDKTPPAVTKVEFADSKTLKVSFSERVTNLSATDTANYKFTPAVKVKNITYDTAARVASIELDYTQGKYYSVSVNGIVDMAVVPNIMTTAHVASKLIFNSYSKGDILISEIFYNDPGANDNYEFIEVTNKGNSSVELGGLKFTTGITFSFDEYTLDAGKSVSVAKITDSCNSLFGSGFLGPFTGALDNTGEKIVLSNSLNEVIDSVRYADSNGWPAEADGQGYSLQLKSPYFKVQRNDLKNAWEINKKREVNFQNSTKIWATPNATYPSLIAIDEIKQNDTNGVNLALQSRVEIRGTVYGINFETSGLSFVVRDATNGIMTFSLNNFGYTVTEGDSVHLQGRVVQSQGLSLLMLDSLKSNGKSVTGTKTPTNIVLPEERYESDLVKFYNLKLAQSISKWPSNDYVKLLSGTDTLRVYIDSETDIDGTNLPAALTFNLTGFILQNSVSSKLDDGYFLLLRSTADIDFTPVPDPEVAFSAVSASFTERQKAGIELKINNPGASETNVMIDIAGGTAQAGSDFVNNFPVKVTFPATSGSNQSFTLSLINDLLDESDETIRLVIKSADNKAVILADSVFTLTIQDNDNPLYPIGVVSKVNAGTGVPDSNNVKVQIRGVVYGPNYRTTGLQFTLRDSTGGMGVFNPTGLGYTITDGDELLISGTVNHFRGLTQISFIDTLVKLSSGKTLKKPDPVKKLNEFSESNLVKLSRLTWAQSKPSSWTGNTNFRLTNGIDTFDIRVDGDIALAGTPVPSYDTLNITGLGGQFSSSSSGPFLNGYQLLPRYASDIEKYNNRIYPIGVVSKIHPTTGVPDSNGVYVHVQGLVYGVNMHNGGLSFTLRDQTGGIQVYKESGNLGYSVKEGDELRVSGTVSHIRGYTRIDEPDILVVTNNGQSIKTPVLTNKPQELYESDLVVIEKLFWAQPKPSVWTANTFFKFTQGTDTVVVYVDEDINLSGTALPAYDTMNITGIVGQVASRVNGPFLDGYYLAPRAAADIQKWNRPNTGSIRKTAPEWSFYPNPSAGNLSIRCAIPVQSVSIYTVSGTRVWEENLNNAKEATLKHPLPQGLYYIHLHAGQNHMVRPLMVK